LARYLPDQLIGLVATRNDAAFYAAVEAFGARLEAVDPDGSLTTADAIRQYQDSLATDFMFEQPTQAYYTNLYSITEATREALPELSTPTYSELAPWVGDSLLWFTVTRDSRDYDWDALVSGAQVTDQARALKFLRQRAENTVGGTVEETELIGATLFVYTPDNEYFYPAAAVVLADALFIGNLDAVRTIAENGAVWAEEGSPYSQSARYTETVAALPADAYGVMGYLDEQALVTQLLRFQGVDPEPYRVLIEAFGGLAGGVTALEEGGQSTLALDMVQRLENVAALEEAGFVFPVLGELDPSFMARVPSNTPLVIHQTNITDLYDAALNNVAVLNALQRDINPVASTIEPDQARFLLNQAWWLFDQTVGVELQGEVQPWMTGDYALVVGGSANAGVRQQYDSFGLPLAFGLIFDVSADPAAAAEYVQTLRTKLEQQVTDGPNPNNYTTSGIRGEVRVTNVNLNGATEAISIVNNTSITVYDSNRSTEEAVSNRLYIAANDEVFVVGTLDVVLAALNGAEDSLADSAPMQFLNQITLAENDIRFSVDVPLLVELWLQSDNYDPAGDPLLQMLESLSVHAAPGPDGQWFLRAAITLAPTA
jgi:hypothetical protein